MSAFGLVISAFCVYKRPPSRASRRGTLAGRTGRLSVRKGTIPACLVGMARPRLRRAGLITGVLAGSFPEPERQLYHLFRQEGGDAYSRYNALIRELVSFEQALDRRQYKTLKAESEKEK